MSAYNFISRGFLAGVAAATPSGGPLAGAERESAPSATFEFASTSPSPSPYDCLPEERAWGVPTPNVPKAVQDEGGVDWSVLGMPEGYIFGNQDLAKYKKDHQRLIMRVVNRNGVICFAFLEGVIGNDAPEG